MKKRLCRLSHKTNQWFWIIEIGVVVCEKKWSNFGSHASTHSYKLLPILITNDWEWLSRIFCQNLYLSVKPFWKISMINYHNSIYLTQYIFLFTYKIWSFIKFHLTPLCFRFDYHRDDIFLIIFLPLKKWFIFKQVHRLNRFSKTQTLWRYQIN